MEVIRGRELAVIFATFGTLAGCSLILDPDDLRGQDDAAVPDARPPDAAPPSDADLAALAIDSVTPAELWEGQGSAGRPIPVVITGSNIDDGAMITFEVAGDADAGVPGIALQAGVTVVNPHHTLAATTVTVPVIDELAAGETVTVLVRVSQGTTSVTEEITLHGLDELSPAAGTYQAGDFAPLYSRIEIDEDIRLVGEAPVRLRATSEIIIAAEIDAGGRNGGTTTGGAPGPGGCAGGAEGAPGGCSMGGGGGGSAASIELGPGAGGGGGFGADGNTGAGGSNGGSAGEGTGNRWLVPLLTDPGSAGNRGNGGGGGAGGTLSNGGGGGGGGGVVELTSDGRLEITAGGSIITDGGNGGAPAGGGGGGGSGGALLVRAHGELVWDGGSPAISAAAGSGNGCGSCNKGGNGGVGRIRLDHPGTTTASGTTPAPVRGPMWAGAVPVLVTGADLIGGNLRITVHGAGATLYGLLVNDDPTPDPFMTTATGAGTLEVPLEPGMNRLCAVVTVDADFSLPEAVNCIDIAYVPDSF
jgi:hypothetical protein